MHDLVVRDACDRVPHLVVAIAVYHQHSPLRRELILAGRNDEAQPLLRVAPLDIGDQLDAALGLHAGIRAAAVAIGAAALVRSARHARAAMVGGGQIDHYWHSITYRSYAVALFRISKPHFS